MIHAVSLANQHLYARQLDQMFRMRHAYYIEGHGWAGLTSTDGKETGEFDDEHVVYLMSLDPFGDVAASVRLKSNDRANAAQEIRRMVRRSRCQKLASV